jgi:hypothetical protein
MEEKELQNTIEMLRSPDEENHVVALTILNNIKNKDNLVVLLLCYKFGHPKMDEWKKDAKKAFNYLVKHTSIKESGAGLTFKQIFDAIISVKVSPNQMNLFLQMFANHLSEQCKIMGYDFIDRINISIKTKTTEDE